MERILVAFEAPPDDLVEGTEEAWNEWVATLRDHGLQLVADLDPVLESGGIQVFEAVRL